MLRTRTPCFSNSGDGIENEPGIAAQAVQFEDQQLIELVQLGIFEQTSAQRTQLDGHGAGDAVVGIGLMNLQLVQ